MLVSRCRSVVKVCKLRGCCRVVESARWFRMWPLMYGMVAVVVAVKLVFVSVGLAVSVSSLKSSLLLFLSKTHQRYLFSSNKLSGVLQTSCARLVRVLIVVALCDVGFRTIRLVICRHASVFCKLLFVVYSHRGLPSSLEKEVVHFLQLL